MRIVRHVAFALSATAWMPAAHAEEPPRTLSLALLGGVAAGRAEADPGPLLGAGGYLRLGDAVTVGVEGQWITRRWTLMAGDRRTQRFTTVGPVVLVHPLASPAARIDPYVGVGLGRVDERRGAGRSETPCSRSDAAYFSAIAGARLALGARVALGVDVAAFTSVGGSGCDDWEPGVPQADNSPPLGVLVARAHVAAWVF